VLDVKGVCTSYRYRQDERSVASIVCCPSGPVYRGTTAPYAIGLYCLTMDTSLLPQLTVYGALMVAATILGYWPELMRFRQSLHDHTALDRVRHALPHPPHPPAGKS